ncbi:actin-like ATPase domain-containing protein [Xylariaceae sp. FL1019]|nr:actin-like ATPase domain-containing protein [Xylariaceae sp. FL1019]
MAAHTFSPRSILLCVLFLFSANVLAVSAVLGVDLGTEYIKAALVKPGIPLEIVLTKDSRRKEASAVTFKPSNNVLASGEYPERLYGSDALALAARFPGEVYPNLKTLLGLPTDDALVKEYAARHPSLQLETQETRGTAAFKSKATGDESAWMVEELLAMELQSIQRNAEALAGSGSSVRSVVITVPPHYTVEEKRAVQLACDLVGLKVLSMISDGLAVGLNYATSRTFPNLEDGGKPEYHMVFDMGAGSTKATVMQFQGRTVKDFGKFNKSIQEVQALGSGWDRTLGGDAFNYLLVDDMISKFVETSAAKKASVTETGIRGHGRAMAKLLKEAERVRHVLSANTETSASFEGLYEDVDFKYKVNRAEYEKMAESHADRVSLAVEKALEVAGVDIKQLDSIILHGGASRTPFVQKKLESLAGSDKLRSNVNSDEAAVFGAGFRAAELSPSFRVKEIRVSERVSYPIGVKWMESETSSSQARLWTQISPPDLVHKEATFTNREDFSAQFYQQIPTAVGLNYAEFKQLTTKNLTDTVASLIEKHGCTEADIQFKVNLRMGAESGDIEIVNATAQCETETAEKAGVMDGVKNLFGFGKNKDQKPLEGEEESNESSTTTSPSSKAKSSAKQSSSTTSTISAESTEEAAIPKKRVVVIPVEYTTEQLGKPSLPKADLTKAKDRLKAFESSDKARRLREETLNQLEGYTYKVRDFLETDSFVTASTQDERSQLEKLASEASDWLYEDGADAPREELKSRLKSLKDLVSPVERRIEESTRRPELVKALRDSLNKTTHWIQTIKDAIQESEAFSSSGSASPTTEATSSVTEAPSAGDFDGLEDEETTSTITTTAIEDRGPTPPLYSMEDLNELATLYDSILSWLDEKTTEQEKMAETADPVLLAKDILEKTKKLEQAGVDMAMRSVKKFESKFKKGSSSKSKTKTKSKKSSKTSAGDAEPTIEFKEGENYIKFGENGEGPTNEEIEAMIKKMQAEQEAKEAKETKVEHNEL